MTHNPFSLSGKTIFVTGASSGIGRSIAVECSQMGARLIISGRNEIKLKETVSLMKNDDHEIICGDIAEDKFVHHLAEKLPLLDGVVHNAGINHKVPVKFISYEKLNTVFETNFFAPVIITQSLLKKRKIKQGGSVLFISSIASEYAAISNAIYSSSKGALNSFLKVLALELAPRMIRVNGIQPGIVRTEMLQANPLQNDLLEHEKEYPLGGFGEPKDIACGAIYLLSDASKWVTGSLFKIDGGITLR